MSDIGFDDDDIGSENFEADINEDDFMDENEEDEKNSQRSNRSEDEEKKQMDLMLDDSEVHYANNKDRVTTRYLTKYERARVLGARALQISKNAPILVEVDPGTWDPLKIAEKELIEKKIPFKIRRYLPDGSYEDWRVDELIID